MIANNHKAVTRQQHGTQLTRPACMRTFLARRRNGPLPNPDRTSMHMRLATKARNSKPHAVVSPFENASMQGVVGAAAGGSVDMTVENVDACLEEVRPYLIADNGNVEVVEVADGNVYLRLQGSCSSCASSSATMKMGIEKALRARFGDALKEVVQVDIKDPGASVESVNIHLDSLRPAIHGLGGSVEAVKVEGTVCEIKYSGPKPLLNGVKAAILDRFPELKEVVEAAAN